MKILVTGGAGYIGSHAVRALLADGHEVTVLDNLLHGHREAIQPVNGKSALLIEGSTGEVSAVVKLLKSRQIETVLHFAADIEVGESVIDPGKYYLNNFSNSVQLFTAMVEAGVKKIVFSSTAAVYGEPEKNPVEESQARAPINPYGRSKMMTEMALEDFSRAHDFGYAILRYFNVAGASPDATIGEDHQPESHLIPRILATARDQGDSTKNQTVKIFGTDYPTRDGTCLRDYIHVCDLVDAHLLALKNLKPGSGEVYNLGSENGFSVREVIAACERVTGKKLQVIEEPRRAGDSAVLVATSEKIRKQLGWARKFPDLETIVSHAWKWHSSHPHGYRSPLRASEEEKP
jgi:UDP-glucose 4-epimerase